EGRREDVADVHLVAEPACHNRGRVIHLDAGHLPAKLARDTERRTRAASHVEIAPGSSPRWAAPPEAAQEFPCPEPRQNGGALVPERPVPEPARERVPDGPDAGRRALERHPRRRLLVARLVVRVARGQVLVAHPWTLVEKAAAATADYRVEAGDVERAVGRHPDRLGVIAAADGARRIHGGQRRHQARISSRRFTARPHSKAPRTNSEPPAASPARSAGSRAVRPAPPARRPPPRRRAPTPLSP